MSLECGSFNSLHFHVAVLLYPEAPAAGRRVVLDPRPRLAVSVDASLQPRQTLPRLGLPSSGASQRHGAGVGEAGGAVPEGVPPQRAHEPGEGAPQLARRARVDEGVEATVDVAQPEGEGERQPGELAGRARRVCNTIGHIRVAIKTNNNVKYAACQLTLWKKLPNQKKIFRLT